VGTRGEEWFLFALRIRGVISTTAATLGQARGVVVVGLVGFAAGAWLYLGVVAARMGDMSSILAMPMTSAWSPIQAALMVTMWVVMMAAMMVPSAVPMVLTYDHLHRGWSDGHGGSATLFVAGYAIVWSAFAVVAAGLQWVLQTMAFVNGMGEATQRGLAGLLLIGPGAFQFSPVKRRSLGACRTPMGFLTTSWQDGRAGAIRMGFHHGALCLRCCWALMILLFVLGVMNLFWVALLAIFVLAEKVSRRGEAISVIGGVVMIVWGVGAVLGG
jgi:predicted metal-binding membrane protein